MSLRNCLNHFKNQQLLKLDCQYLKAFALALILKASLTEILRIIYFELVKNCSFYFSSNIISCPQEIYQSNVEWDVISKNIVVSLYFGKLKRNLNQILSSSNRCARNFFLVGGVGVSSEDVDHHGWRMRIFISH